MRSPTSSSVSGKPRMMDQVRIRPGRLTRVPALCAISGININARTMAALSTVVCRGRASHH